MTDALHGQCHCGAVRITIPSAPDYINDCNCSLCVTRGALWGYFPPSSVAIIGGPTGRYVRSDLTQAYLATHWCQQCGSTTHWTALDPSYDRMGVNMRLFAHHDWADVAIRRVDGRSRDG